MTRASELDYYSIPGWCAGIKVSLCDEDIDYLLTWSGIVREIASTGGCVAVVSVNCEELKVIEWLEKNKFHKTPEFRNHQHGGRKTFLYMKQVTKSAFEKYY